MISADEILASSSQRPVCFHLVGASSIAGGGGSNTFIRGLALRQRALGWDPVVVLSEIEGDKSSTRSSRREAAVGGEPFDIRMLPAVQGADRRAYYARRPAAAPGVVALFDELRPSVVHFHTLNSSAGLLHLRAAKAANARTVVTYHTGGISCPQTGLLENGKTPCDGRLEVSRCTRCRFVNRGMPSALAQFLARIGIARDDDVGDSLFGRMMSSRSMTRVFLNSFHETIDLIDVFHIQSQWIRDVLRANGVPDAKLAFVEMGVSQAAIAIAERSSVSFSDELRLRLVFAGRCIDVKGIETILAALKILPRSAPVQVSLIGSGWDTAYGSDLLRPFANDTRLLPPRSVANENMLHELAQHDACLVPSIWLETGPLAVYEAMAAGVPVIGSRLGGIAERIQHDVDGLLFRPGDASELAAIVRRLLDDPGQLARLRRNIKPQRTFDDMARDLDEVYRQPRVGHRLSCAISSEVW